MEGRRDRQLLAGTGEEVGHDGASQVFVFAEQLEMQEAVRATEDFSALQRGSRSIRRELGFVAADEELVGSAVAEHIDLHQHRSDNDGVNSVGAKRIDWMQLVNGFAFWSTEGDVPADLANSTAGFGGVDDITVSLMLILQTHFTAAMDAAFLKTP
jgi:hypothetical protein